MNTMVSDPITDGTTLAEAMWPVVWFEGLQLLPQHFQLQDRRVEALSRQAATMLDIGFDQVEWDAAALARGNVRVHRAHGRFPDLNSFAYSDAHGAPLEMQLAAIAACDGPDGVIVSLAMPSGDFIAGESRVERWIDVPGEPVADRHNPDERAAVMRQRPHLVLRIHDPQDRHWQQLPVLQVRRRAGQYESLELHPPARRLLEGTRCAQELRALAALLRTRVVHFADAMSSDALAPESLHRCERILSLLTGELSLLEALLADMVVHPYALHLQLCALAGRTAALAGRVPEPPPRFHVMRPDLSVLILCGEVRQRLQSLAVVRRRYAEVPMTLKDDIWSVDIPEGTRHTALFLVRFSGPPDEGAWLRWVDAALVSPAHRLQRTRELRVRGLVRRSLSRSRELGLAPSPSERLLEIDLGTDSSHDREPGLVISGPGVPVGAVIESIHLVAAVEHAAAEHTT
ncbi:type VI secretion system baseplate subunit TssK [Piscinibacter sp.]|uniref:type VI secretion system baseplate subunit TssK n=1 Tax=Piscinibacter sp. TaxID=1903157 RepID=UPI002C5F0125|nr:type VI secretion system baseplate subunit TssK [Albitalea sp.]HUG22187.1 type VI secretion system baseplate subunit TssK [Albitalea sp.]